MQQVSPPLTLASALLGLAALQCGPPVAQPPPPTPVYSSELDVPPTEIIQGSLRERADDTEHEASPAGPASEGAPSQDPDGAEPDTRAVEDSKEAAPAPEDAEGHGDTESGAATPASPKPPASPKAPATPDPSGQPPTSQ